METTESGPIESLDPERPEEPRGSAQPFATSPELHAASAAQRYEIGSFLGSGGMAEVYKGYDRQLERPVALKFLVCEGAHKASRLLAEARSQAVIDHPHVCKVYEVGTLDGRPFIAMQLIAGRTLREVARGLGLREKLRLLEQVAQAVSVAHRLGVIHRDIKPGNILVEQTEDGSYFPYIVDFGLAERTFDVAAASVSSTAGTAPYMAPEQVRGVAELDHRTDIYGLGATLYDLLTGRPPFSGSTRRAVGERVLTERPISIRRIDPRLSGELEEIVDKCLEKQPTRRYDSARALADDLGRILDGEPILARASSWRYRTFVRLRKHRGLVVVLLIAMVALFSLGTAALIARWNAQRLILLAAELGREINQNELSMRLAYLEPRHDIRRDRAQVRQRMEALSARVHKLGTIGIGPGRYALGRAHLSLGNPGAALIELSSAWAHGQRGADVLAARGRARALLYEQALRELGRRADAPTTDERRTQLERELRDPALRDLRSGSEGTSEEPLLLAAEIAYLEQRSDDVRRITAQILAQDPARFEAHALVGRVDLSLGRDLYHQGRHLQAEVHFAAAARSFAASLDIARSHPPSHEDLCEVESLRVFVSRALLREEGQRQSFDRALAACRTATVIDPESGRAELLLALTHYRQAQNQIEAGADPRPSLASAIQGSQRALSLSGRSGTVYELLALASTMLAEYEGTHGGDPQAALDDAIRYAQRAAAESPNDVAKRRSSALAWYQRALYEKERGLDPRAALEEVVRSARRAIELAPQDYDHYNDLACAYGIRAAYEIEHGLDPEASLQLGIGSGREAVSRNPEDPFPAATLADLLCDRAEYQLMQGQDPTADLRDARSIAERAIAIQEDWPDGHIVLGRVLGLRSRHLVKLRRFSHVDFAAARESVERGLKANPSDDEAYVLLASLWHEEAAWSVQRGQSPRRQLLAARRLLRLGRTRNPRHADLHRLLAEGFLIESTSLKNPLLITESALPALEAALAENPNDARTHVSLAEACLAMATAEQARGASSQRWRERGLAAAARALEIHPGDAAARRVERSLGQQLERRAAGLLPAK